MKYVTLTGRQFDLAVLGPEERRFLRDVIDLFRRRPDWDEFSAAWVEMGETQLWQSGPIPVGRPLYRICQDLAARLGVAEGRLARPDYRDQLADRIEERFGSRYHFCQETGVDPAHLSRVLAGRKHFSAETLFRVLEVLGLELAIAEGAGTKDGTSGSSESGEEWLHLREMGEIESWLEQGGRSGGIAVDAEPLHAGARIGEEVGTHA